MDFKRIAALFILVGAVFATIAVTSPHIVDNIKLGLDLKGGFEILYEAEPVDENGTLTKDVLREAARSIEQRANANKVAEPEVTPEGENRIRVKLAGVENQEEVRRILKKPAELTFRSSQGCESPTDYCKIEMNGNDFVEGGAKVEFHPDTNLPIVAIEVKDPDKFAEITERLLGQTLAIYMDDQLQSAPVVQGILRDGTATITGSDTIEEARQLAQTINLGALPVRLTELYTQSVGATLGQMSLEQTLLAATIGSVVILLFMLFFYRLPGVVAGVTLVAYTWMLLLVMYWMKATLTLPGIAALVLGLGMAVDANILTFERIKEEIRSGKSLFSSLRAGSRNSLRTILDANITTILAAIVLYYIGTGLVQGFALTLIFSILVSMVTNVLLSRWLLHLLIRGRLTTKPAYFGVKEEEISEL